MNLKLRSVDTEAEARALTTVLARAIGETTRALDEDWDGEPEPLAEAWIDAAFGDPAALLIAGRGEDRVLALAATAPFSDPLSAERLPMLVVLWVDPSVRHRGVARALVAEVRRLLRGRGFEVLTARAGTGDDALLSMGERFGLVRRWEFLASD